MILKRIEPFSLAKVSAILYAILGLLVGILFSLAAVVGSAFGGSQDMGLFGEIFGVGSIIFLPIFYGVIGFVGSLIVAFLFNLVTSWVGGIGMEFEHEQSHSGTPQM
ncbi:MAG: hypothetical protein AB1483_06545 [Candidatus Zixiibacteriota bacterium]